MPDNGSVFQGGQPQAAPTKVADGSIVEVLVGEGKKYKSVDDLAKSYMEADDFIETLKSENASLREANLKAKTIDDVLERMNTKEVPPADKPVDRKAPTADELATLVNNAITGRETARTRDNNLKKADADMKKLFGEKAQEVFSAKATTPELKRALTELASVDPAEFVALFTKGSEQPQSSTAAATGGFNAAGLGNITQSTVTDPSTKAYYDEVRKKDRVKYYSSDFQLQMHKAAQANPDKFFGRAS